MIYRELGKTGIRSSAVGLGTWNLGNQWGELDEATAFATVRAALDSGVNLIDTAEAYGIPYGVSEERIGRAIAGVRHQVVLVGKVGHWGKRTGQGVPMTTVDMFVLCCQASLHRLRTDYIDIYLCHVGNLTEAETDIYLEGLEALKERGMIRHYGISTDDAQVLRRFNRRGTCQVVEAAYSLLDRRAEQEIFPYAAEQGMGVLTRGPLAMGLLSGKYNRDSVFADSIRAGWNEGGPERAAFEERMSRLERIRKAVPAEALAETAIRFTASHPCAPVTIPGAKSADQAAANARAGQRLMGGEERAQLSAL